LIQFNANFLVVLIKHLIETSKALAIKV